MSSTLYNKVMLVNEFPLYIANGVTGIRTAAYRAELAPATIAGNLPC